MLKEGSGSEGKESYDFQHNMATTNIKSENFFIALLSPTTKYVLFMKFYQFILLVLSCILQRDEQGRQTQIM